MGEAEPSVQRKRKMLVEEGVVFDGHRVQERCFVAEATSSQARRTKSGRSGKGQGKEKGEVEGAEKGAGKVKGKATGKGKLGQAESSQHTGKRKEKAERGAGTITTSSPKRQRREDSSANQDAALLRKDILDLLSTRGPGKTC